MIALSVNNISLSFGTKKLLSGISFALDESDRLGIIGVNGCGKSTLFRLILGEIEADEGNIFISKDKSVGILRQDDAIKNFGEDMPDSTALEIMYCSFPELLDAEKRLNALEDQMHSGIFSGGRTQESCAAEYTALNEKYIRDGGLEFRARCASTLMKMGFDSGMMKLPFSALSGGQKTRLALCRELCREPDILMLDEPTNHLDIETLGWLESFLASYKKCVLVISHDRYFLDRVTNKTLCIENTVAKLYNGGYTQSMEQRRADAEIAERHYKNQQKEIARQEAYIAQQRAWNRERNIVAAESRQKMLDKMEKLEKPKEAPKAIKMRFSTSSESGGEVLSVRNLKFGYAGGGMLFDGFSLLVKKNERLFIVGANGCGKSTLIKLLMGRLTPDGGYIEAGYNVNIGYYDQENQNLTPENTVLDELWNAYPQLPEVKIRGTLAMFRFTGDDVYKSVSVLSGGERARLTLAKLILSQMNVLILDEPTNHLDIDSREALETALSDFEGTIIAVSHDRYFIEKIATRIIDIKPGTGGKFNDVHIGHIGSGYEELCRERERLVASDVKNEKEGNIPSAGGRDEYMRAKRDIAEARRQQHRLERLEKESRELESELEKIEQEMTGSASTDYVRLSELDIRKNEIEERLLVIYEEIGV